ncbi:NAD(P)H-quinone oxidoreductase subunit S [Abeliophyllum distichum]|uniref:NAD(P)H-quinone oxidoreductase subunit S n=1 Tax=Abeliophyllum distichum TaxID=126358 RepID=A0ABD1UIW6_9LAMI
MASSFHIPNLQGPLLHKSHFLGQPSFSKSIFTVPKQLSSFKYTPTAKFNLYEILGGRGLCNGEEGLLQELKKPPTTSEEVAPPAATPQDQEKPLPPASEISEDGFDKELLGLTGGFPGGEKGLIKFIEQNPPPKKGESAIVDFTPSSVKKPKAPELPLLLPGMIAIVKNPNNPFYRYCGIVQRITDGKAGVLFEGGNWDRLVTFRLDELERREKGPPMVNPKSAILETMVEDKSS